MILDNPLDNPLLTVICCRIDYRLIVLHRIIVLFDCSSNAWHHGLLFGILLCLSYAGDSEETEVEEFQVKELSRAKPGADIANEVWSAKEQDGTSVFTDHSDKVKHEA